MPSSRREPGCRPSRGSLALTKFVDETPEIPRRERAAAAGVDQSLFSKYCKGQRKPKFENRLAILRISKWHILPEWWDEAPLPERRRARHRTRARDAPAAQQSA